MPHARDGGRLEQAIQGGAMAPIVEARSIAKAYDTGVVQVQAL